MGEKFSKYIFSCHVLTKNNKHSPKDVRIQDEDVARRGRLHNVWMQQERNITQQKLRKKIPSQSPKKT